MSAPTLELLSLSALLVAFAASVSGSLHCLGMCGPLRLLVNSRAQALQYQAGRLFAYLFLGIFAGWAGSALPLWLILTFCAAALATSLLALQPLGPFNRFRQKALSLASAQPWALGLASGLLPCGLLHAWILAAAATRNPFHGGALLLVLWLGTVPALEGSATFLRRPLQAMRKRFPKALPICLLLLALVPVALRAYASPQEGVPPKSHCEFGLKQP